MVEVAIRKPEKFILFALMLLATEEYARNRLKLTRKEVEAMKPRYLKGPRMFNPYILLPKRDKNGELQFIDLSYFAPWAGWTQGQKGAKWLPQPLQIGNPFIMFYNAYVSGFDSFTGQPIARPYHTLAEQRKAKADYMRTGILPDLLGGRATERIIKVIKDEPDYYGRKPDWKKEVLRDLTGLNIVLGGETTTGVANWKAEQDRARIERKRPVKLALVESFKNPTNGKLANRAIDLLKTLPQDEVANVIKSAAEEFAGVASGAPAYFKLSNKEKALYNLYMGGLK